MSPLSRVGNGVWYTPGTCAEDRATLESDLSADTRPKTGQMPKGTALLVSAQFLAESDKLTDHLLSICAMGRSLWDRFATETTAIGTPGVVGSGWFWDFELMVESFGVDHFGLADRLVENGVR